MKRLLILHPILFTLYPILYLFSVNAAEMEFGLTLRSFAIGLAGCALVWYALQKLIKDGARSGLMTTLIVVLFFSYGHIETFLTSRWKDYLVVNGKSFDAAILYLCTALYAILENHILLTIFAVILLLGARQILRRTFDAAKFSVALNLVGVLLVIMPGINLLLSRTLATGQAQVNSATNLPAELAAAAANPTSPDNLPDIYYIILDSYGEASMLRDIYGLDNSDFIEALEVRGFVLPEASHSNYMRTYLSVSSSMNLDYLGRLVTGDSTYENFKQSVSLIEHNQVVRFLDALGYETILLDSGVPYTKSMAVDRKLAIHELINPFEEMLLSTTLAVVFPKEQRIDQYQDNVIRRFETIAEVSKLPGPKFVFAHLLPPHAPFAFDQDGNRVNNAQLFTAKWNVGLSVEEHQRLYSGQLLYINKLTLETLDAILANSAQEPVIILQADHGPGSLLDENSAEGSCLRERMSILNAYRLPGGGVELYPGITPVNTFRLIFNRYFGTNLARLEDRSYFSPIEEPYNFIDVTGRLDTCAPLE